MKWFKHLVNSTSDPDLMESETLFKSDGPYVFWRVLEILAREDTFNEPFVMDFLTFSRWFPSVSKNKLNKVLCFFAEKKRFLYHVEDKNISLFCNKLLTISGDYAVKLQKSMDKVQKVYPPEIEEEVDIEEEKKEPIKTWRTDFSIYLQLVKTAYQEILSDPEEMKRQEEYYPNVDIRLSLKKSIENFWGIELGWKNKKKKKSKEINMRRTLINNLDKNKVYKSRDDENDFSHPSHKKL